MKKFITITLAFIIALAIPLAAYATTYIGNRNSWKFHYQGCRWERKMNESNRIIFPAGRKLLIWVWFLARFAVHRSQNTFT